MGVAMLVEAEVLDIHPESGRCSCYVLMVVSVRQQAAKAAPVVLERPSTLAAELRQCASCITSLCRCGNSSEMKWAACYKDNLGGGD